MRILRPVALLLCFDLVACAAQSQTAYGVTYSGGSLPSIKAGQSLRLLIDADAIRLFFGSAYRQGGDPELNLKASSITEISYGQEVHRRIIPSTALAIACREPPWL